MRPRCLQVWSAAESVRAAEAQAGGSEQIVLYYSRSEGMCMPVISSTRPSPCIASRIARAVAEWQAVYHSSVKLRHIKQSSQSSPRSQRQPPTAPHPHQHWLRPDRLDAKQPSSPPRSTRSSSAVLPGQPAGVRQRWQPKYSERYSERDKRLQRQERRQQQLQEQAAFSNGASDRSTPPLSPFKAPTQTLLFQGANADSALRPASSPSPAAAARLRLTPSRVLNGGLSHDPPVADLTPHGRVRHHALRFRHLEGKLQALRPSATAEAQVEGVALTPQSTHMRAHFTAPHLSQSLRGKRLPFQPAAVHVSGGA